MSSPVGSLGLRLPPAPARSTIVVSLAALVTVSLLGVSAPARADVTHVVARGHTIEAIAHRYHVPAQAILDKNHLTDPRHLKVGDTLIIPGVTPVAAKTTTTTTTTKTTAPATGGGAPGGLASASSGRGTTTTTTTTTTGAAAAKGKPGAPGKPAHPAAPVTYAMRPKTPGVIHATRLATSEDFLVRTSDRRGRLSPTSLQSFERMLRSAGNQTHPIDQRLVTLAGIVSNHFGSRKIEVISGFRPYRTTQYTQHSNHNVGKAMDFRVVGVPNEVLRDFCRTLHNVGVGYYPNSTFVHLDVRPTSSFWIDYSKPGEAPHYNAPNLEADEGTSDVGEEVHAPTAATPPPSDSDPVGTAVVPPAATTTTGAAGPGAGAAAGAGSNAAGSSPAGTNAAGSTGGGSSVTPPAASAP